MEIDYKEIQYVFQCGLAIVLHLPLVELCNYFCGICPNIEIYLHQVKVVNVVILLLINAFVLSEVSK